MCKEIRVPAIVVENIVKKYDGFEALKGVSFTVERGEIFGLLGPNGAGKTTLLNIIAGVIKQSSGKVIVEGIDITSEPNKAKKIIGFMPQELAVYDSLSGYENLLFYAGLYGIPKREATKRVSELLKLVGLENVASKRAKTYSGGMVRRLAIATALINNPKILLLDEPTSGLDPDARRRFWDFLLKLKEEGKTVIIATHYVEEAEFLADRVAIMYEGKIIALDTPENLKKSIGPLSVIEVETKGPTNISKQLLAEFSEERKIVDKNGLYKIYVRDPDRILPVLVEKLASSRVKIVRIHVVEPSLEDVFIKLVGRRIEE